MLPLFYYNLLDRAVISVSGIESKNFLQSLITNDINLVSAHNSIYSCLLSPQGKYNYDFFISNFNDKYFIEIEHSKAASFIDKLNIYKLRKKIEINYESEYITVNIHENNNDEDNIKGKTQIYFSGLKYIDPRNIFLGSRAIINKSNLADIDKIYKISDNYDFTRINLMIAEGEKDLVFDKSFPLEFGLDKNNAISFSKGCYIGQEVTARTKYRGVVRKKIYKATSHVNLFKNDEIYIEGCKIGYITSSYNNIALALIREEEYENLVANKNLTPHINNEKITILK